MRFTALALVAGAALAMTAPADAQAPAPWKSYISRDLQFSFSAPGNVTIERGTYKGERSGDHAAVIFRSSVNGIDYRAVVVDFNSQVGDSASLLEEAVVTFMGTRKTLMDNYGRIGDLYGRKMTVDLPNNGGRSMASFYFNKGYLYQMQATVTPQNGDFGTPDLSRFVDSEVFQLRQMEATATELRLPPEPAPPPAAAAGRGGAGPAGRGAPGR
jgi:hypothetical protein